MGRSSDGLEPRRKRILFQAWHRGTKEMDLVLGRFVDAHLAELDETELGELETLMNFPDPDLFSWIAGQEAVPDEVDSPMLRRLVAFHLGRS